MGNFVENPSDVVQVGAATSVHLEKAVGGVEGSGVTALEEYLVELSPSRERPLGAASAEQLAEVEDLCGHGREVSLSE